MEIYFELPLYRNSAFESVLQATDKGVRLVQISEGHPPERRESQFFTVEYEKETEEAALAFKEQWQKAWRGRIDNALQANSALVEAIRAHDEWLQSLLSDEDEPQGDLKVKWSDWQSV